MKTLITFLLLSCLAVAAFGQTVVTLMSDLNKLSLPRYQQKQVNTVTNTVPVRLSTTNLWCRRVTLLGLKQWRTNNSGNVWIGVTSTNDQQPFVIIPGGEAKIEPREGTKLNLYNWWLDSATNADGVVMILDHF